MIEPLKNVISDIADALVVIDSSRIPYRNYQPGVGPYGEPQLLRKTAKILNSKDIYRGRVETRRKPDLFIRGSWAIEFKLARPFGDNGREAENWSVNLLHPYDGSQSTLGDCLKLRQLDCSEKKAIAVVGYEHDPPVISLEPLIKSFEILAEHILKIKLGPRIIENRKNLIHPIHRQLTVYSWQVL